jgi:cytochrome c5
MSKEMSNINYLRTAFLFVIVSLIISCSGDKKNETDTANGQLVYNKSCQTCHTAGIVGAARLDDIERWKISASKDSDELLQQVIAGYNGPNGVIPAMGACGDCSDQDIADAIAYMFLEAGVEIQ